MPSPDQTTGRFLYTAEMRERALTRIAERRHHEDADALMQGYMRAMLRAFLRRAARERKNEQLAVLSAGIGCPPLPKRLRRASKLRRR